MKSINLFRVLLAVSAVMLFASCSEMSMVMKSDVSFSEKVKQLGSIVGRQFDQQSGTRADAIKKYNYAGRDYLLEIDSTSLTPEMATPGATIESFVQYTALMPNDAQQVKLSETRTLVSESDVFQLSSREITHDQGTQLTKLKFTLPKNLAKGSYTLVTTLSFGRNTKTARNALKVI